MEFELSPQHKQMVIDVMNRLSIGTLTQYTPIDQLSQLKDGRVLSRLIALYEQISPKFAKYTCKWFPDDSSKRTYQYISQWIEKHYKFNCFVSNSFANGEEQSIAITVLQVFHVFYHHRQRFKYHRQLLEDNWICDNDIQQWLKNISKFSIDDAGLVNHQINDAIHGFGAHSNVNNDMKNTGNKYLVINPGVNVYQKAFKKINDNGKGHYKEKLNYNDNFMFNVMINDNGKGHYKDKFNYNDNVKGQCKERLNYNHNLMANDRTNDKADDRVNESLNESVNVNTQKRVSIDVLSLTEEISTDDTSNNTTNSSFDLQLQAKDKEIDDLRAKIMRRESVIDECRAKKKKIEKENSELQLQIASMMKEKVKYTNYESLIVARDVKIKQLNDKIAELTHALTIQTKQFEKRVKELTKEVCNCREIMKYSKAELLQFRASAKDDESKIKRFKNEIQTIEQQLMTERVQYKVEKNKLVEHELKLRGELDVYKNLNENFTKIDDQNSFLKKKIAILEDTETKILIENTVLREKAMKKLKIIMDGDCMSFAKNADNNLQLSVPKKEKSRKKSKLLH